MAELSKSKVPVEPKGLLVRVYVDIPQAQARLLRIRAAESDKSLRQLISEIIQKGVK
jgi:hypothetical protein